MRRPVFALSTIFFSLVLFAGCGNGRPSLVTATGQIKLNGEPLSEAIVFAEPVETKDSKFGRPSTAVTDSSGNFKLGTYSSGDGVPPGKYRLGVMKRENVGKPTTADSPEDPVAAGVKYSWTVPEFYSDVTRSGIEVNVSSSGMTPNVIDLKREGPPQVTIPGQRAANEP